MSREDDLCYYQAQLSRQWKKLRESQYWFNARRNLGQLDRRDIFTIGPPPPLSSNSSQSYSTLPNSAGGTVRRDMIREYDLRCYEAQLDKKWKDWVSDELRKIEIVIPDLLQRQSRAISGIGPPLPLFTIGPPPPLLSNSSQSYSTLPNSVDTAGDTVKKLGRGLARALPWIGLGLVVGGVIAEAVKQGTTKPDSPSSDGENH